MSLRPGVRIATSLLRPRASGLPPLCLRQPNPALPFLSRGMQASKPPPPLLVKIKEDLKTAMREKDAARLSVVRGVLAAVTNASKTPTAVTTDERVVGLLHRQLRAGREAREEFATAGRADLVAAEDAQIAVLEAYVAASGVEEVGGPALEAVVKDIAHVLEAETGQMPGMGEFRKAALGPGGLLEGKRVDMAEFIRIVKGVRKGTIDRIPPEDKYSS